MLAMTLATLGWATWWVSLALHRLWPAGAPGSAATETVTILFAVPGMLASLLTLRAKKAWVFFATVAFFANASLLAMPWLAAGLFQRGSAAG